jgi:hypothetical protein
MRSKLVPFVSLAALSLKIEHSIVCCEVNASELLKHNERVEQFIRHLARSEDLSI